MTCINCSTEFEGKFCPNCGQRANVKRMSLRESWTDFWSRVYGFDGMFPRTMTDLTVRPGVAAKRFIGGNRVMYYGPVGYFFLMITVCLLVFGMIGIDYFDFIKGMQKAISQVSQSPKASEKISDYIQRLVADNLKIFAFLIIPFEAFTARYLVFRKSGFNFLEHSVLPFYMQGHLYWFTIFLGMVYAWTGFASIVLTSVVSVLYIAFGYATMMTYQSKTKAFMKGILLYFISQALFTMVVVAIASLVILGLFYFDPAAFDAISSSSNR